MKILITGVNGYIGKSLYNALKDKHKVVTITRQNVDLTDMKSMSRFFSCRFPFDVVLHCASAGGSRLKEDGWDIMNTNLQMYYNLLVFKDCYHKLIVFGSGAEVYDTKKPYGFGKRVIAKSVSAIPNFYNIRLYGIFDENELDTRFIKANIKRHIANEPMKIEQVRTMSYFYMPDLIKVVEYYLEEKNPPKVYECVYEYSAALSYICGMINLSSDYTVPIEIERPGNAKQYVGKFQDLGLEYIGLYAGVKETYNKLKCI